MSTNRVISLTVKVGTKHLAPGWRFKVGGSGGYLTFMRFVSTGNGSWIEAIDSERRNRAVEIDQVKLTTMKPPTAAWLEEAAARKAAEEEEARLKAQRAAAAKARRAEAKLAEQKELEAKAARSAARRKARTRGR